MERVHGANVFCVVALHALPKAHVGIGHPIVFATPTLPVCDLIEVLQGCKREKEGGERCKLEEKRGELMII